MRFAIAHPCLGSSESVLRIRRSSVPCTRSFGFAILWLSTISIVDCQCMVLQDSEASTVDSTRGAKKQQPILPADRRAHPGVEPGKCGRTRRARNPQYVSTEEVVARQQFPACVCT